MISFHYREKKDKVLIPFMRALKKTPLSDSSQRDSSNGEIVTGLEGLDRSS